MKTGATGGRTPASFSSNLRSPAFISAGRKFIGRMFTRGPSKNDKPMENIHPQAPSSNKTFQAAPLLPSTPFMVRFQKAVFDGPIPIFGRQNINPVEEKRIELKSDLDSLNSPTFRRQLAHIEKKKQSGNNSPEVVLSTNDKKIQAKLEKMEMKYGIENAQENSSNFEMRLEVLEEKIKNGLDDFLQERIEKPSPSYVKGGMEVEIKFLELQTKEIMSSISELNKLKSNNSEEGLNSIINKLYAKDVINNEQLADFSKKEDDWDDRIDGIRTKLLQQMMKVSQDLQSKRSVLGQWNLDHGLSTRSSN